MSNNSFKDLFEKYSAFQDKRININTSYISFFNDKMQLHRDNGPALIYNFNNQKHWFIHGKRHREDGPAIEDNLSVSYWLDDASILEEDYWKIIKEKYTK